MANKLIKCVASYDLHITGVAQWTAYDGNNDIVGNSPLLVPLQEQLTEKYGVVDFTIDWNI